MADKVTRLRRPDGTFTKTGSAASRVAAREKAAANRAKWMAKIEGAKVRAGTIPRELTVALGYGVAGLMLAKIMNGELTPTTAKEAADVARVAAQLSREEVAATEQHMDAASLLADRQEKIRRAAELEKVLAERARQVVDASPVDPDEIAAEVAADDGGGPGASNTGDGDGDVVWDFGDHDAPGAAG